MTVTFRTDPGYCNRVSIPLPWGYRISIVAGVGLYSSPRKYTEDYSTVEIAVFDADDKFVRLGDDDVAGYVPAEELSIIIAHLVVILQDEDDKYRIDHLIERVVAGARFLGKL